MNLDFDTLMDYFTQNKKIPLLGTQWRIVDIMQQEHRVLGNLTKLRLEAEPDPDGHYIEGKLRLVLHKPDSVRPKDEQIEWIKSWVIESLSNLSPGAIMGQFINNMQMHPETRDHQSIVEAQEKLKAGDLETPQAIEAFISGLV